MTPMFENTNAIAAELVGMVQVFISHTLYLFGCIEAAHDANHMYPRVTIISCERLADVLLQRN